MRLFDKVFVINLARRPDRRQIMIDRIAEAGISCPVEFVEAVDGAAISPGWLASRGYRDYPRWKDPSSSNPWYCRELKWGEIGCSLSHHLVWSRIVAEGLGRVAILEDDARFCADFAGSCVELAEELPRDFDLLYLFRVPLGQDAPFSRRLAIPGFSHCTVAYVVTGECARALVGAALQRNIIPVDEFLPALYAPGIRADVEALFGALRIKAYAAVPNVIEQDPKDVMGSDTEASAFKPPDA